MIRPTGDSGVLRNITHQKNSHPTEHFTRVDNFWTVFCVTLSRACSPHGTRKTVCFRLGTDTAPGPENCKDDAVEKIQSLPLHSSCTRVGV